jgi:hypothetical protein
MNVIKMIGTTIAVCSMLVIILGIYIANAMNKWMDVQLTIPIVAFMSGLLLITIGSMTHEEFPEISR